MNEYFSFLKSKTLYNIVQIIDNEEDKQINNDNIYIGAQTLTKLTQKLANIKQLSDWSVILVILNEIYSAVAWGTSRPPRGSYIKKSVTNIHAKYYAHSTHKQLII